MSFSWAARLDPSLASRWQLHLQTCITASLPAMRRIRGEARIPLRYTTSTIAVERRRRRQWNNLENSHTWTLQRWAEGGGMHIETCQVEILRAMWGNMQAREDRPQGVRKRGEEDGTPTVPVYKSCAYL
jgi:hypothetical protein